MASATAMAKHSAAARREQRHAKREAAYQVNGAKIKKGGVGKKKKRGDFQSRNAASSADEVAQDESPMAVIKNGKAVWTGGGPAPKSRAAPEPVAEEEEAEDERFAPAEKKLRALRKKLRRVEMIRERRRRGEEIDPSQQLLLKGEAKLREEITRFEREVNGPSAEDEVVATDDDDAAEADAGDADVEQPTGGSRLEQKRALKRKKHAEKVRKRLEAQKRAKAS